MEKTGGKLFLECVAVFLAAGSVAVQGNVTFSIDRQGPTLGLPDGFGPSWTITEGDILSSPLPTAPIGYPLLEPCPMGPRITVAAFQMGLVGPPMEIDALSGRPRLELNEMILNRVSDDDGATRL